MQTAAAGSASSHVLAIHNFAGSNTDEIPFRRGDLILVVERDEGFGDGWWTGQTASGKSGLFPAVYTVPFNADEIQPYATSPKTPPIPSPLHPNASPMILHDESTTRGSIDGVVTGSMQEQTLNHIEEAISQHLEDASSRSASVISSRSTLSVMSESENPIGDWTTQQVGDWILSVGFGEDIAQKFLENDISGYILLELESSHLKELEITSFGKRFELMKRINELKSVATPKPLYRNRSPLRPSNSFYPPSRSPHRSPPASPIRASNQSFQNASDVSLDAGVTPKPPPHQSMKAPSSPSFQPPSPSVHNRQSSFNRNWTLDDRGRSRTSGSHERFQQTPVQGTDEYPPALPSKPLAGLGLSNAPQHRTTTSDPSTFYRAPHIYQRQPTEQNQMRGSSQMQRTISGEKGIRAIHSRLGSQDTLRATRDLKSHKQTNSSLGTLKELKIDTSSPGHSEEVFFEQKPFMEDEDRIAARQKSVQIDPSTPPRHRQVTEPINNKGQAQASPKKTLRRIKTAPSGLKQRKSGHGGLRKLSVVNAKEGADYHGWMRKRSEKYGTWQSRYFVLRDTRLAYYYTEQDEQEQGLIDITSYRAISHDADREGKSILTSPGGLIVGGGKHTFKLVPPAPGKASRGLTFTPQRVHHFSCHSADSLKNWISVMTKANIELDESFPVVSTYSADTISLESAQSLKQRPPQLENTPTNPKMGNGSHLKNGTGSNTDDNDNFAVPYKYDNTNIGNPITDLQDKITNGNNRSSNPTSPSNENTKPSWDGETALGTPFAERSTTSPHREQSIQSPITSHSEADSYTEFRSDARAVLAAAEFLSEQR